MMKKARAERLFAAKTEAAARYSYGRPIRRSESQLPEPN